MLWVLCSLPISCATNQPSISLQLIVDFHEYGKCDVRFQGEAFSAKELYEKLRKLPRGQEIRVKGGSLNVPYRCIGGAIFVVQRAKLKPKFDFAAEPPLPVP